MKKDEILRSLLLNADSAADIEIQHKLIMGMISLFNSGTEVDADEFELLVEDVASNRTVSVRRAKKLLEQTKAFTVIDKQWQYNDKLLFDKQVLKWEEFVELFVQESAEIESGFIGESMERSAILGGMRWTIDMCLVVIQDGIINGLPAFFSCNDECDQLIGVRVAGTATFDALSLLCQSLSCLFDCGKSTKMLVDCLSFLLNKTIACQCTASGWDKGGFFPLEDQPESDHPTVDATCLAIMAICSFYEQRNMIEERLRSKIKTKNKDLERVVMDGLDFLFRMQLSDGSFGIYKYEDGREGTPNENCTRMVQSTMGVCKGSGIFNSTGRFDLYCSCTIIISDVYNYLSLHTTDAGKYKIWAPYFGAKAQDYNVADVIVSTARVCRSFIPVWRQCEDERENIVRYCYDFLHYWYENEEKVIDRVGRYRFNSPTENGFSAGEYFWPSRPDMLAAFTVLQAYNIFGLALTKEEWALIERTVQRTLKMQHPHGHWDNPLAEKTPFCAVTLAAIELLQEFQKAKGLS